MDHVEHKHPAIPEDLSAERRKVEYGLHLWEGPRDPRGDFVERTFQSWPMAMQEKHFAEALLMAARGAPSVLVAPVVTPKAGNMRGRTYPPIQFLISELVDDTMGKYSEQVLALAADRAIVWRYGKELIMPYQGGLINQALGAALVGICLELHEFICTIWDEVQTARAPLSVVHNHLSPYFPLFSLLRDLLDKHEGRQGCVVIKQLEAARAQYLGFPVGELTLKVLLDHTSRPFFDMLGAWIYEGRNVAPWEFPLVRPTGAGTNFLHWELAPSALPTFLQPCADKVLQCGKLALILKQAGQTYQPKRAAMQYSPDPTHHAEAIGRVFDQANAEVLRLLKVDHQLMHRIKFLHHFVLCGNGAWVGAFMDHCWTHPSCGLDRVVRNARWDELQRAMKNVCEASAGSTFPKEWVEGLRLEPANKSLIRMVRRMAKIQSEAGAYANVAATTEDTMRLDMEVIQAIQLNAELEWPISLVIHPVAYSKYQLLGRLVLRVKGLLYSLHRFRRRGRKDMTPQQAASFRAICALRAAMIHFLSNLENYLLFEVIEPGFVKLQQRLAEAKTVDEIVSAHDAFTDEFIVSAMATSEGLYKRMEMVFLTVRLFASALQNMNVDKDEAVRRFHTMYRERLSVLLREMQASSSGKGESEVKSLRYMLNKLDFNRYYLKEGLYGEGAAATAH